MTGRPWRLPSLFIGMLIACNSALEPSTTQVPSTQASAAEMSEPVPQREHNGVLPVLFGDPIPPTDLVGRIVFDDFADIYTMNADGSDLRVVAGREGEEFDASWSPDGAFLTYRDSRRGINNDDEIYVVSGNGTNPRNLTNDPANDWGPDWSPDGEWIAFNSDRDSGRPSGFLVRPDGTDLRPIAVDGWVEYISFSPDSKRIVYSSHAGSDFDVWVADLASGERVQLTDAGGSDGWPVWSPDGSLIAFSSQRDDCLRAPPDQDCWRSGDPGEHHDIWLMNSDGSGQRRVTPETGQFVAWSPDGRYLLISGHTLYVVRPDGTGRTAIEPADLPYPPGGLPDWIGEVPEA